MRAIKVVLVFTTVILIQITGTRCKQKGLKTFYDYLKKSNIDAHKVPTAHGSLHKSYSNDGSITAKLSQSILKDFEFPDVEYPMFKSQNTLGFRNDYSSNKFNHTALTKENMSDLSKRLNTLRKEMMNKRKFESAGMLLHNLPDLYTKLPNVNEFPEVQYPQSALEMISPIVRNYMPFCNYELNLDNVYNPKADSTKESEFMSVANYKNMSSIISRIMKANQNINKLKIIMSSKKHIDSLNNKTALVESANKTGDHQHTTLLPLKQNKSKENFDYERGSDSLTQLSDCTNTPAIKIITTETATEPVACETYTKNDVNLLYSTCPPAIHEMKVSNGSNRTDLNNFDISTTTPLMTKEIITTNVQPYHEIISTSFTDEKIIFTNITVLTEVLDTSTKNNMNQGVSSNHTNAVSDLKKSSSESKSTYPIDFIITTSESIDVENIASSTCPPTIQDETISTDNQSKLDAIILDPSTPASQITIETVMTTAQPYHTTSTRFKEAEKTFTSTTASLEVEVDITNRYNVNEGVTVSEDYSINPISIAEYITTKNTMAFDQNFTEDHLSFPTTRTVSDELVTTQHLNRDMDVTDTSPSPYKATDYITVTAKPLSKVTTIKPAAVSEEIVTEVNSFVGTTATNRNILTSTTEYISDTNLFINQNLDNLSTTPWKLDDSISVYYQKLSTLPERITTSPTYATRTIEDSETNIPFVTSTSSPTMIIDSTPSAPFSTSMNDEFRYKIVSTTPLPFYTVPSMFYNDAVTGLGRTTVTPTDETTNSKDFEDNSAISLTSHNYNSVASISPYTKTFQVVDTPLTTNDANCNTTSIMTAITRTLPDTSSGVTTLTEATLDLSSESEVKTRINNLIVIPQMTPVNLSKLVKNINKTDQKEIQEKSASPVTDSDFKSTINKPYKDFYNHGANDVYVSKSVCP